jgi:hypothetical protein
MNPFRGIAAPQSNNHTETGTWWIEGQSQGIGATTNNITCENGQRVAIVLFYDSGKYLFGIM